jgi:hypothetical protein
MDTETATGTSNAGVTAEDLPAAATAGGPTAADADAAAAAASDVCDTHSTLFLGQCLEVQHTPTGGPEADMTGGWMWPASSVVVRFLEVLLPALVRADGSRNRSAGGDDSHEQRATALQAWMQMPHAPRSVLDFSSGPGLVGIAAGVALGAQVGGGGGSAEIHLTDFGEAQLSLIRRNCAVNRVRASVTELRWGSLAAELPGASSFPATSNGTPEEDEEEEEEEEEEEGEGEGEEGEKGGKEDTAVEVNGAHRLRRCRRRQKRLFFDLVVCSDCLYIACRDDLQREFVATLLSLVGPDTVVLLAYTPRRPDEPDVIRSVVWW